MLNQTFKYSTIQFPSIKQHGNKHLAFIDPSKAEEDKLCEEYLKEMIELNKTLKQKPYNMGEIQRSDLITISMKTEVLLKQTIQSLLSHQDPISAKYLKEELEQAEKRARRHYFIFQDNLLMAQEKDKLYKKRPYLSHGTYLKLLIILQCNIVQKLRYASESMEVNGSSCFILYTLFYVFAGVPVQFAMRAVSQYSKNTVITMWNFCPFFKGCAYMILMCTLYFMLNSVAYSSILFYMLFDFLKGNIGWATCAGVTGKCYDKDTPEIKNISCKHSPETNCSMYSLIPCTGISYYRTVTGTSFSGYEESLKWDGLYHLLLVWFIILIFTMAGFKIFVKIADRLFFPIIVTGGIVIVVMLSNGEYSSGGLKEFLTVDFDKMLSSAENMLFGEVFFDCLVSNGLINFLAAHAPHDVDPMVDTYVFAITDLTITFCVTLAAFNAAGYLEEFYKTTTASCFLVYRDVTLLAIIPEFLVRLKLGKLWIFLYLMFALMSQLVFIAMVIHMTVDSFSDTIGLKTASSGHSSLILLLIGCGFTFNIFFDFAHNTRNLMDDIYFMTDTIQLSVVCNFITAIVCMYSSTSLCKNVYLITKTKPSDYCEFSLKLSLVICLMFGIYDTIILIERKCKDEHWNTILQLLLLSYTPLVISIINRISTVFHTPSESLFGCDANWTVNGLVKAIDPTKPRYKKSLSCTHRCLRQFMFHHFEESRLISFRKCFAVVHAPHLVEQNTQRNFEF